MLTYYGLFALQHRGQESAGIVTAAEARIRRSSAMWTWVSSRRSSRRADLERLKGTRAIGHVRYSTTGIEQHSPTRSRSWWTARAARSPSATTATSSTPPCCATSSRRSGSIFQTTVDSEIILHLLAQPTGPSSVLAALRRIQGAFSLVMMSETRNHRRARSASASARSSLGKLEGAYVLSSETCAFDLIHAEFVREIEPGEVVIIDENGIRSRVSVRRRSAARSACSSTSISRGPTRSSATSTSRASARRWDANSPSRHPVEADIVVPVPDCGNYAALGFAEELGIRLRARLCPQSLHRPHLSPAHAAHPRFQRAREAEPHQGDGGRETRRGRGRLDRARHHRPARVMNLREAGAKEVHMRICCPPHRHACHYGIDFPDPEKLIANQHTLEADPRLPRRGLHRLPRRRRHGARHGPAEEELLPRVLQRRLPGAGRSRRCDKFIMERRANRENLARRRRARSRSFSTNSS